MDAIRSKIRPNSRMDNIIARGVQFRLEGGAARVIAPPGALSAADKIWLEKHREQVLALLVLVQPPDDSAVGLRSVVTRAETNVLFPSTMSHPVPPEEFSDGPDPPALPVVEDDPDERAALQAPVGMPAEWKEGMDRLRAMPPPDDFPRAAWRQVVNDAARFIGRWGDEAAWLGWTTIDLFGAHREAPYHRLDEAGLVLLIGGNEVVKLTETEATIRHPSGATTRHQRGRMGFAAPIWDLNTETTP